MNDEKYNQIIDDTYQEYLKQFEIDPIIFNGEEVAKGHNDQCWGYPILDHVKPTSKEYKRGQINAYLEGKADKPFFYLTQEEFINKIKIDNEFAKKWGLKIEERELSDEERYDLVTQQMTKLRAIRDEDYIKYNIPTKLITVTYKNETIEIYE
jgi:hypothetical protein